MEKLEGFNNGNKSNIMKLKNPVGTIAGEGVNYAMGSDFTFMSFGTGGVNVSFDNLKAAFGSAMVWNTTVFLILLGKTSIMILQYIFCRQ